MAEEKKIWFPAKRYGWGWGPPVCWQGWAVLGVWMVVVGTGVALLRERPLMISGFVVIQSIVLTAVCWWKGEPPKWRWGGK